jgi:outer membrane protein assembly factor BamE (lipoprotein component of BamABCDE complex)
VKICIAAIVGAFLIAPVSASAKKPDTDSANMLTHGMAQMTLHVGSTTQTEVIETFGAPNITTLDADGQEVWVYDRQATVSSSGSSGFSIGMLLGAAGGSVGGGGGLGFGSSKSKSSQTQRTMTLIIKFGSDKRVIDFKSRRKNYFWSQWRQL